MVVRGPPTEAALIVPDAFTALALKSMHALSSGFIHESPDQFQFVAAYAARSRGPSKRKLPDFLSPKQLHPQPPQKDGCDGTLRLRVRELQFRTLRDST